MEQSTPSVSTFAPIVDLSRSPHARLRPVSIGAVNMESGFWGERRATNRSATLLSQYEEIEATGRLDNFRRVAESRPCDTPDGEPKHLAADSDVYKWMEAVAWNLASPFEDELQRDLEAKQDLVIDLAAKAQDEDGYLCTAFMFGRGAERWQDLKRGHELYCGGHLLQAAVAHHRATGKRSLLDVGIKWADGVCAYFGPGRHDGTCGHPEVEMALVELFRETGEQRYLDLAVYFTERRGHTPFAADGSTQYQDAVPVREQTSVDGHVVRQFYLCSGITDIYAETGDQALWETLLLQWKDAFERKQYVNGGTGVYYCSEGFSRAYDLPNRLAYGETCAAISWVMWNWRMLQIDPRARYADAMELSLYNAVLSAVAPTGESYFYVNPLESDGKDPIHRSLQTCARTRALWDRVACCPPNIARTLAQLPGYLYSVDEAGIWAHHYATGRAELAVQGATVVLRQETEYPWQGTIQVVVDKTPAAAWTLRLRIPGWARGATLRCNGEAMGVRPGSYAEVRRVWQTGDEITLQLFDAPRLVRSHPYVLENTGRVAVFRGPILYCAEACDHPEMDVRDLGLDPDRELDVREDTVPALAGHGSVVLLEGPGRRFEADDALYFDADAEDERVTEAHLKLVPYFAWANREIGPMKVWLRRD